jgi:AraC-like DNA-binding protein
MLGDGIDPVLLCHIPEVLRQRLTTRLEPDIPVLVVVTVADLSTQLDRHPMSIAVVGLAAPAAEPTVGHLTALRDALAQHAERVVVGALFGPAGLSVPTVSQLAKLGLGEIFTLQDGRELDTLALWIRRHRPRTLHAAVWTAIEPYVDPRAATLFKIALRLASAPYEVADLAAACKTSERTLRRMCEKAGLPSVVWLKAISRLLSAEFLLDQPHSSIDAVSARLGFNTTDALREKARKWTGRHAMSLSEHGWIASMGPMLNREITR